MPSINPYAREILKKNIFKNINSFYELEKRIATAGNIGQRGIETTKGDIFEVFVEALLNINNKYIKDKTYPSISTPISIKDRLKISQGKKEMGFDGVYCEGNSLNTYQVKFRNTETGSLTWKDLSTFIGVSEDANYRHLFTNIEKVSKEFISKKNIVLTTRKDFIKLKKFEFTEIENWLYGSNKTIQKHKPEKYQLLAIKDIHSELLKQPRTTAIMACGTGKTNIALWVYEKLKPKLTIVFVPSIALVKQIRADWLEQISISGVKTLQVCSFKETSAREDQLMIERVDLDFQVTTDAKIIKSFVKKNQKNSRIIFSTYQSSLKLSEGLKGINVDFAFFDEAHRTARLNHGKKPIITGYTLPLYDKYIKIKKRLFMTATRRISNPHKKYDSGENQITYSMENKELYGKISHSLSFKKAADLGVIAKFKIVLNFITSSELKEELRKKSTTLLNGDEIRTEHFSRQLALSKAIKKYKINKVFSFHRTVNRAKTFVSKGSDGIEVFLNNIYTDFIHGNMKISDREVVMERYTNSKKGIISNARCLIEGVDVPSVEMVAFMDNKNSEIDIVQAAGRALRNRGLKKKIGYIFVPIFINQFKKEKISKSLERSEFENVVQVLRAMANHDNEIAQIISQANYESKTKKGISYITKKKISDFFGDSGLNIPQETLIKFITTKAFSKINTTWDERILELRDFKKEYGDLNITNLHKNKYRLLYRWVNKIRKKYEDGELFNFQISELEKEGFHWKRTDVDYELDNEKFVPLRRFYKFTGHSVLKKAVKDKILIPRGYINKPGADRVAVYRNYSPDEFKKLFKITHFHEEAIKDNLHTISGLSTLTGLAPRTIDIYVKQENIKPAGRMFGTGSGNKKSPIINYVNLYKKFSKEDVFKALKITIEDTSNLLSRTALELKIGVYSSIITSALDTGKIESVGQGMSSAGVVSYYKKYSNKEIEKILGLKLKDIKKLVSKKYYKINSKLPMGLLLYIFKKRLSPVSPKGLRPLYIKYNDKELLQFLNVNEKVFKKSKLIEKLYEDYKIKYSLKTHIKNFKELILKSSLVKPVIKFKNGRNIDAYYTDIKLDILKKIIPSKFFK